MLSIVLIVAVFLACSMHQVYFFYSRNNLAKKSWEELVDAILPTEHEIIRELAKIVSNKDICTSGETVTALWLRLGGTRGLRRLHHNSRVMLQLAIYAERWNPDHGRVFAELIRQDVIVLRRLLIRIEILSLLRLSSALFSSTLVKAAKCYEDTSLRLQAIYAESHAARLSVLRSSI